MSKMVFDLTALVHLAPDFLDSRRCERWLTESLHPAGFRCPQCAEPVPAASLEQFFSQRIVSCRSCRKQYSARTETVISGCHFSAQELFTLSLLHEIGLALPTIAARLGRDRGTCHQVMRRIRKQPNGAWPASSGMPAMPRPVECVGERDDETND